jgi:ribosome-binding protein aMBF1 (putative translation factor)
MIKNERQYNVSKIQLENLQLSLEKALSSDKPLPDIIKKAMIDGIKSKINDLKTELSDYESLKNQTKDIVIHDLSELPNVLIQARIARNLTQEQLANLLNMKYQQIQRYEAQNYSSISLDKLLGIIKVLGINLKEDALFEFKNDINENKKLIIS